MSTPRHGRRTIFQLVPGTLILTTGPFFYLLARQCRIYRFGVSFSTMAGVRVRVPNK